MIRDLHLDKTSGASELVETALEIFKSQLDSIKDPETDIKDTIIELSRELLNVRPSMAPIINTIGYFLHDLGYFNKKDLLERFEIFYQNREKRIRALFASFNSFLEDYKDKHLNFMLISYSTTILKCIQQSGRKNFTFYILEARPLLEGRRTAEKLSSDYETHLITDSSMGKFIKSVDVVLIGIDSILRDGSIVNKIGTHPLSCIATENEKKVFEVGASYKYNLKSHFGKEIIVEDKPIYEVYNKRIKKEKFHVHNYYFDITPSKYINGIISDLGMLTIHEFLDEVVKVIPLDWLKAVLGSKILFNPRFLPCMALTF
jgi:translation initiation factor 2B subunit (eIF-2B alpha/beta/delta family)